MPLCVSAPVASRSQSCPDHHTLQSPAGKPRKTRSRKSSSKRRSHSEREVGKSRRYHSEDKPSSRHSSRGGASDVSTDTDEWSAVEKQQAGLLPSSSSSSKRAGGRGDDSDDSFDASQLPERVPTDDTSGYVESREELIEDAKAQRRTEQCVISVSFSLVAPRSAAHGCARTASTPRSSSSTGASPLRLPSLAA